MFLLLPTNRAVSRADTLCSLRVFLSITVPVLPASVGRGLGVISELVGAFVSARGAVKSIHWHPEVVLDNGCNFF